MAKKQTKKYTRSSSASTQSVKPAANGAAAIAAQDAKINRVPRRVVEDNDFNPDYTPIIRDLKRIGILAGSFFVVLVALSFFL